MSGYADTRRVMRPTPTTQKRVSRSPVVFFQRLWPFVPEGGPGDGSGASGERSEGAGLRSERSVGLYGCKRISLTGNFRRKFLL